jgi:hypothetical protein
MFDDTLKATWKRAEAGTPPLSRAQIEERLRPMARWSGRALEGAAWTYLCLLTTTAVLSAVNLFGYRENSSMLAVESGLLAASLACAAFSGWLIAGLRRITRADLPLIQTVERRLAFHDRWFGAWLATGAATPWLLSLAINTLVDNQDGAYRINHPIEFAALTAVMIGCTYVMLRVSLTPSVRALQAVLHDLRAEALETTPEVAAVRRRARTWLAVGVLLLALSVILGVLVWFRVV